MEAIWSITAISSERSGRVLATLRKEKKEVKEEEEEEERIGVWRLKRKESRGEEEKGYEEGEGGRGLAGGGRDT